MENKDFLAEGSDIEQVIQYGGEDVNTATLLHLNSLLTKESDSDDDSVNSATSAASLKVLTDSVGTFTNIRNFFTAREQKNTEDMMCEEVSGMSDHDDPVHLTQSGLNMQTDDVNCNQPESVNNTNHDDSAAKHDQSNSPVSAALRKKER